MIFVVGLVDYFGNGMFNFWSTCAVLCLPAVSPEVCLLQPSEGGCIPWAQNSYQIANGSHWSGSLDSLRL